MADIVSDKKKGGAEKGRSKHRSPNYPLFDLEKAVERVKVLYETDKTHKVPIGVVQERWGYKKQSGAGDQAVAAVKAYGLITVEGNGEQRQIAVNDVGRRIVLNAPDRAELIKAAAVSPSLFGSLWERYRADGLPSNDVLRHHLVFDRNVNEDFVDKVMGRFRSTVVFAKLEAGDKIGTEADGEGDPEQVNETEDQPPPATKRERRKMTAGIKEDVFSLDEGAVVLQWPERLSAVSAQDLKEWLALIGRKIQRAATATPSKLDLIDLKADGVQDDDADE